MFPVYLQNGDYDIPEDEICYIVAKEGIFLKKKLDFIETLTKVDRISTLHELGVKSYAKLHIPKIPESLAFQTYAFFKKVYEKFKSEAIVLLFYNKDANEYRIAVPKQEVSAATLKYARLIDEEIRVNMSNDGFIPICSIHSHGSGGAFHSGIDDGDEASFDGLHITYGDINNPSGFSIAASIVSNGSRFKVKPTDYIDGIDLADSEQDLEPIDNSDVMTAAMHPVTGQYDFSSVFKTGYSNIPFKQSRVNNKILYQFQNTSEKSEFIFDESWMDQVVYYTVDKSKYKWSSVNTGGTASHPFTHTMPGTGSSKYLNFNQQKQLCSTPCEKCEHKHFKVDVQIDDIIDELGPVIDNHLCDEYSDWWSSVQRETVNTSSEDDTNNEN